jgi:hypothetical protein
MILTHFGINNQTFTNGGAAGSSGTGYGAGKNEFIFTMHGMNMRLYYQKKDKNLVCHWVLDCIITWVYRLTMASTPSNY